MDTLKKYWKQILGALAAIAGVLLYSRNKQLEGELSVAKTDKEGSILETKREAIKERQDEVQNDKTELSTKRDAERKEANTATPDEVKDFYKKRLN